MKKLPAPEILAEGNFLRLVRHGHWEYADRTRASGAVVIAALTPEHRLLLVEQYRVPLRAHVIELPAGLVGDTVGEEHEELATAARRELLEETGYLAGEMVECTSGPISAGLATEEVTFFVAKDLEKTASGGGVDHEEIIVHEVDYHDLMGWLDDQAAAGKLIDPKIFAGMFFLIYVEASAQEAAAEARLKARAPKKKKSASAKPAKSRKKKAATKKAAAKKPTKKRPRR